MGGYGFQAKEKEKRGFLLLSNVVPEELVVSLPPPKIENLAGLDKNGDRILGEETDTYDASFATTDPHTTECLNIYLSW